MRRVVRGAIALLAAALLLPACYLAVALVLGLIPANAGFRSTPDGIPVYVRTNGVHAELVLQTRGAGVDWTTDHPASDMRALAEPLPWIAFGWGDAGFFATTPTWSDLRFSTALAALSGRGDGAMHVEYLARPGAYAGRELRLTAEQHARLVDYVRGSFLRDASERPRRLPAPGYFASDAFYAAAPRYSLRFTSNEWVRRGLQVAGVRVPLWAPFDAAIFFQLRDL
ncbi:MAG: TIGR02117 family protein [Burkholderiaceae bacterium]